MLSSLERAVQGRSWRRQFHQLVDFQARMDLDMVTAESSHEALPKTSTANHPRSFHRRKMQENAGK